MSEETSSNSKDKESGLDLGLTSLLNGGGAELQAASKEVGSLSQILQSSVEQSKQAFESQNAPIVENISEENRKYHEFASAGRWQDLSKYCEDRLAASRDLDRSAKLWWIKSQYETSAIPVSILAPSLSLISKGFLSDQGIAAADKKVCSELLPAFTKNLIQNSDYELALSFIVCLTDSGNTDAAKPLFKDLEKKVQAGAAFENTEAISSEINALKSRFNFAIPEVKADPIVSKIEIPVSKNKATSAEPKRRSGLIYVLAAVVILSLLSSYYLFTKSSLPAGIFKPTLEVAMQMPEQTLIEPEPDRVAGLNHLDALLYEVTAKEKADEPVRQPAITTGYGSPRQAPVAMIPNRSQQELENIGRSNAGSKQDVNTTYPLEQGTQADSASSADEKEEIPEIDFPPFRSNRKPDKAGSKNLPNYIVIAGTRVMSEPSYWSFSGANLREGDKVLVEEVQGKWLKIKAKNGNIGYILAQDAVKIY